MLSEEGINKEIFKFLEEFENNVETKKKDFIGQITKLSSDLIIKVNGKLRGKAESVLENYQQVNRSNEAQKKCLECEICKGNYSTPCFKDKNEQKEKKRVDKSENIDEITNYYYSYTDDKDGTNETSNLAEKDFQANKTVRRSNKPSEHDLILLKGDQASNLPEASRSKVEFKEMVKETSDIPKTMEKGPQTADQASNMRTLPSEALIPNDEEEKLKKMAQEASEELALKIEKGQEDLKKELVQIQENTYKNWKKSSDCVEKFLISLIKYSDYEVNNTEKDIDFISGEIKRIENRLENVEKELNTNISIKKIMEEIQLDLKKKDLKKINSKASCMLNIIRPININEIQQLTSLNEEASLVIKDKNIILLLGATGTGKSTSLHYLVGSKIIEDKIKGICTLTPIENSLDSEVIKKVKISPLSRSETRSLYAMKLPNYDKEEIFVCDTPGFGDNRSPEIDIANCLLLLNSVGKAKSVRPVFHISYIDMGARLNGLREMGLFMERIVPNYKKHSSFLSYFFTKFPEEGIDSFKGMIKTFSPNDVMQKEFIDDLVIKLNEEDSEIFFINPLNSKDSHKKIVEKLIKRPPIVDPGNVFRDFLSERSRKKIFDHLYQIKQVLPYNIQRKEADLIQKKLEEVNFIRGWMEKSTGIEEAIGDIFKNIDKYFLEQYFSSLKLVEHLFKVESNFDNKILDQYLENYEMANTYYREFNTYNIQFFKNQCEFNPDIYLSKLRKNAIEFINSLNSVDIHEYKIILKCIDQLTNLQQFSQLNDITKAASDFLLKRIEKIEGELLQNISTASKEFDSDSVLKKVTLYQSYINYSKGKKIFARNQIDLIFAGIAKRIKQLFDELLEIIFDVNRSDIAFTEFKYRNIKKIADKFISLSSLNFGIKGMIEDILTMFHNRIDDKLNESLSHFNKKNESEIGADNFSLNLKEHHIFIFKASNLLFLNSKWKHSFFDIFDSLMFNVKTTIFKVKSKLKGLLRINTAFYRMENTRVITSLNTGLKFLKDIKWFLDVINPEIYKNEVEYFEKSLETKILNVFDWLKNKKLTDNETIEVFINSYNFCLDSMTIESLDLDRVSIFFLEESFKKVEKFSSESTKSGKIEELLIDWGIFFRCNLNFLSIMCKFKKFESEANLKILAEAKRQYERFIEGLKFDLIAYINQTQMQIDSNKKAEFIFQKMTLSFFSVLESDFERKTEIKWFYAKNCETEVKELLNSKADEKQSTLISINNLLFLENYSNRDSELLKNYFQQLKNKNKNITNYASDFQRKLDEMNGYYSFDLLNPFRTTNNSITVLSELNKLFQNFLMFSKTFITFIEIRSIFNICEDCEGSLILMHSSLKNSEIFAKNSNLSKDVNEILIKIVYLLPNKFNKPSLKEPLEQNTIDSVKINKTIKDNKPQTSSLKSNTSQSKSSTVNSNKSNSGKIENYELNNINETILLLYKLSKNKLGESKIILEKIENDFKSEYNKKLKLFADSVSSNDFVKLKDFHKNLENYMSFIPQNMIKELETQYEKTMANVKLSPKHINETIFSLSNNAIDEDLIKYLSLVNALNISLDQDVLRKIEKLISDFLEIVTANLNVLSNENFIKLKIIAAINRNFPLFMNTTSVIYLRKLTQKIRDHLFRSIDYILDQVNEQNFEKGENIDKEKLKENLIHIDFFLTLNDNSNFIFEELIPDLDQIIKQFSFNLEFALKLVVQVFEADLESLNYDRISNFLNFRK